jgi:hypothetical protein
MSDPEQKITREELHNWVWTRPFVKLAREIGYAYLELAAICEDLNIPRPSGGYWNRLERGLAEIQEPLPPAPLGKPTGVPFGKRKDAAQSVQEAPESKTASGESAKQNSDGNNPKPATKSKPHPEAIDPPIPIVSQSNEPQPEKKPLAMAYTREQLYKAIWTTPRVKLAAELGISDVALAKTCRRLGIPRPLALVSSRLISALNLVASLFNVLNFMRIVPLLVVHTTTVVSNLIAFSSSAGAMPNHFTASTGRTSSR